MYRRELFLVVAAVDSSGRATNFPGVGQLPHLSQAEPDVYSDGDDNGSHQGKGRLQGVLDILCIT